MRSTAWCDSIERGFLDMPRDDGLSASDVRSGAPCFNVDAPLFRILVLLSWDPVARVLMFLLQATMLVMRA